MRDAIYCILRIFSSAVDNLFRERLRVLAYHDIEDPETFEDQVIWLKSQYNIIDIPVLKDHLFRNKKLPVNPLLITLDDGDKTVFTKGLPILKKHQVPCCLFIITDLIDSNKDFWWNTIIKNEKINRLPQAEIMDVINKNKSLSNRERIKYLKKYPATFQEQLTLQEVKELYKCGVYIGNHSHTHPMFNRLEKKELLEELEQVHEFFKENGVGDYGVFAYPNGNFNEYAEQLLRENKIEIAFLFDHKVNKRKINPMRISRIAVDSYNPLSEFKTKVSGLHPMIRRMQKQ